MRSIKLEKITLHGDTQPRADIDLDVVDEYAAAMKNGAKFPPAVVFFDGVRNWLVDGFHRWHAARKAGLSTIRCDVHKGTLEEARWFSYTVNPAHGLRRSNADKQKAVVSALRHPKGAKMSNRQIAEHVGVSEITVRRYREELESTATMSQSDSRIGRDGRTTDTANIGKKSEPDETDEASYDPTDEYEYEEPEGEEEGDSLWKQIESEAEELAKFSSRERVADFLDAIVEEVRENPTVASARLENLAVKLKKKDPGPKKPR